MAVGAGEGRAQGGGVGASPGDMVFDNVLRGGSVVRSFALFNSFEEGTIVWDVSVEGEAGQWMSIVTREDRDNPLTRVQVDAGESVELELRIDVPEEVPNGTYEAEIRAVTVPEESEGMSVALGVAIPVTMDVVGTQVIAAALGDVVTSNTEVGLAARTTTFVSNTGNVMVVPVVDVTISRDGEVVAELTRTDIPVFPERTEQIPIIWDTTDARTGTYDVTVSARVDDLDIGTGSGQIELFARGEITRQGELVSLELLNEPQPGTVARFAATVVNTGSIESRAVFVGELFREGELIDGITSVERLLDAGETGVIQFIMDIPDEGDYRMTGLANFEGKDSDPAEVEFSVRLGAAGDAPALEDNESSSAVPFLIGGVVVLALAVGGFFFAQRRRAKKPGGDKRDEKPVDAPTG